MKYSVLMNRFSLRIVVFCWKIAWFWKILLTTNFKYLDARIQPHQIIVTMYLYLACATDEEIDSKLSNGFVGYSYPQY